MLADPLSAERRLDAASRVAACPSCDGTTLEVIYRVPSIPVHSCVLLDSAEAALTFPKRDLELAFCVACGFVFNRIFDQAVIGYSTGFEESQHFSGTFSAFARELVSDIAIRCDIRGKRILEIGCGKGEFLIELCEYGNARGLGIDPGYRADKGRTVKTGRAAFIVDFFGAKYMDLPADVVLCRHTLEHISQVRRFIRDIRDMIGPRDDVWVMFETPDCKRVLAEGAFWDIYYEHCSYFSPGAHARVFREQAFEVTGLELAYDAQYIIQYAKPAPGPTRSRLPLEPDLSEMHKLAESFAGRVRAKQEFWRERVGVAHAEGRRVVLWGGGSKAVSFLTTLEIGPEVQAAVDVNRYKQGKFTPGSAHPIVAPDALKDEPPDTVIVMNPIYVREVTEMLKSFDLEPEILAL